jgi:hypothetical protein
MHRLWYPAIALAIGLLCSLAALADKPVKPPPAPTREFVALYPGQSAAYDVNDAGLIVGVVMQGSISVAGYWNASDATPTFTPLVEGYHATAVNENGAVVATTASDPGPALYFRDVWAEPVELPPLPGGVQVYAGSVSLDDIVVGASSASDGTMQAVAWRVTDGSVFGPIALDPLAIESAALGVALDGTGHNAVVGHAKLSSTFQQAVIWDLLLDESGGFTVAAGPTPLFSTHSAACAITDAGDIAGHVGVRAFVIRGGQLTYLAVPRTHLESAGYNLNDTEVVGYIREGRSGTYYHGERWSPAAENLDVLLPSGWTTSRHALGVDNLGRIVGCGWFSGYGDPRAWLIRPL